MKMEAQPDTLVTAGCEAMRAQGVLPGRALVEGHDEPLDTRLCVQPKERSSDDVTRKGGKVKARPTDRSENKIRTNTAE